MNKHFLFALSLICLFLPLCADDVDNADAYLDLTAGEKLPIGVHADFHLPSRYLPDVQEEFDHNIQVFIGESSYKGDRRYDPFEVSYRITIQMKDRTTGTVDWTCKMRSVGTTDWIAEDPVMFVKNLKWAPSNIWGDMYFKGKDGKDLITRPFLAFFVIDHLDHDRRGILLIDRYEGIVFLPRQ